MTIQSVRHLFGASLIAALTLAASAGTGDASTLTTLLNIAGLPFAGLISDPEGALYGTTFLGGDTSCGGCGTVFKLTPPSTAAGAWTETALYSFSGGDGRGPLAGLISDASGALYGTTALGGGTSCPSNGGFGCGTVFKLTPPTRAGDAWTETVLYSFQGGSDGFGPIAGLLSDSTGALYGTTEFGGNSNTICTNGFRCGTVFELTPPSTTGGAWTETVLYSFTGGSDGGEPFGGLISDASGALYGTAAYGGNTSCGGGCGTVFKLTPPSTAAGAWTETVLYSFSGSDGGAP